MLITTYHEAFLNKGGGEVELLEVVASLQKLGVSAEVYGPRSRPLEHYDAVLHFSVHGGGLGLLRALRAAGKRIILWPNLWVEDPLQTAGREVVQEHLDAAERIVVKSRAERGHISSLFEVPPEKMCIVPAGVDPAFGVRADEHMFKTIYGVDDYILWLGILEERKNQLFAIEALAGLDQPVVFVGNHRDRNYYQACRKAAPGHFQFLPAMPPKSEILRSTLQNCRLFLEATLDPPGASALEAGLAGANLVLSQSEWAAEHFGEMATFVDPTSKKDIREGVEKAWNLPPHPGLPQAIGEKHLLPGCLEPLVQVLGGE